MRVSSTPLLRLLDGLRIAAFPDGQVVLGERDARPAVARGLDAPVVQRAADVLDAHQSFIPCDPPPWFTFVGSALPRLAESGD